jgi:superfamily II DNA/RNA helicase
MDDASVFAIESAPLTPTEVTHHVLTVSTTDKAAVVWEVARHAHRAVLFTRTKRGATKLAGQLRVAGIEARELHGNLSQPARQRNLDAFANGTASVLVATDIAARGIHVDDIDLVLHVDPPAEHKAYVHRSGRTARAGATGVVATMVTPDQARNVHQLTRAAGISVTTTKVTPGHPLLAALSQSKHGSAGRANRSRIERSASHGTAAPRPDQQRNNRRSRGRQGRPQLTRVG